MTSKRKALCIGINYVGQSGALRGCIRDAEMLRDQLESWGFDEITLMTDSSVPKLQPTRANILKQWTNLIQSTYRENVSELWISYSGHGSFTFDHHGDEDDFLDETLVPLDYQESGMITDDDLYHRTRFLHPKTQAVFLIDACHSGTMIDLPYRWLGDHDHAQENGHAQMREMPILSISGCMDTQTSMDAFNLEGKHQFRGAMTTSFLAAVKGWASPDQAPCWDLLRHMRGYLKARDFVQIPQLCSAKILGPADVLFSRNNAASSDSSVSNKPE